MSDGARLAVIPVEVAMIAGSILTVCVLAAAVSAPAAGCDPATARLGRGICALEPVPDGVRATACVDASTWTIAWPGPGGDPTAAIPAATPAVEGYTGSIFHGATLGVIKQGQAVDVLVSDGAFLWMGVSERQGCALRPRGLVRYHAKRDAAHAFRGTDTGPCGFHVQDLLLRDETLWVATDLGVSRLRVSPEDWDEWTHYSLSSDRAALEETACASLLAVVAEAAAVPGGEELGRWLAEFRPRFVKRLGARIKASRRGTRPASSKSRRRDEEALGHSGRTGVGRRGALGALRGGPGRP